MKKDIFTKVEMFQLCDGLVLSISDFIRLNWSYNIALYFVLKVFIGIL